MSSLLENLPDDVIQHIGFLCTPSSVIEPLADLSRLLLTSRRTYASLSYHYHPHLYAAIFRVKFDNLAAPRRFGCSRLTDSSLAIELIQRLNTLHHIRQNKIPDDALRQDLWTVLSIILENDGLNEVQLRAVGFTRFVMGFIRQLWGSDAPGTPTHELAEAKSLAIWLLSFSLSRHFIASRTVESRNELLALLHPYVISSCRMNYADEPALLIRRAPIKLRNGTLLLTSGPFFCDGGGANSAYDVLHYSRRPLSCPDPSSAAILLTFALYDTIPLQIPPHLPSSRAVALATQREGPTMEDYHVLEHCKTPLAADIAPSLQHDCRSVLHDHDFGRMMLLSEGFPLADAYTPGMLTGLWEGSLMIAPYQTSFLDSGHSPAFVCRKPIQCSATEYVRFKAGSQPQEEQNENDVNAAWGLDMTPLRLIRTKEGKRLLSRYERVTAPSSFVGTCTGKEYRQVSDVIVVGETLHEHEEAWGAYRWAGRIRLLDGRVVMKREAKYAEDSGLGMWTFVGYIHSGLALVGRWCSNSAFDGGGVQGIFRMRRAAV